MSGRPFFSVIIPTYNRAAELRRALNSVKKQSFKDFEVIVSDDGSSDGTKEIVESFLRQFELKYICAGHWGGPARPRNMGMKIARGKYIAFLDSDDWWYPDKLNTIGDHIYGWDVIYHDLDIYTPKGKKLFMRVKGRKLKQPVFTDLMQNENALITSAVVIKKDIVEQAGCFIEEAAFISVEDFDYWLRVARVTEKFRYLPKSLGAYWLSPSNISGASLIRINRIQSLYQKHFHFLRDKERDRAEALMSYLLARTKQKVGLFKDALGLFRVSATSNNPRFKLRSIFWLLFLNVAIKMQKIKQRYKNEGKN